MAYYCEVVVDAVAATNSLVVAEHLHFSEVGVAANTFSQLWLLQSTSVANATDTLVQGVRVFHEAASAVAVNTITTAHHDVESPYSSTAHATDEVFGAAVTFNLTSTANATNTYTVPRDADYVSVADATNTLIATRRSTESFASTARAVNTLHAAKALVFTATGAAVDTGVFTRRPQGVEVSTGVATDTAVAVRRVVYSDSTAGVAVGAVINLKWTAHEVLSASADAENYLSTSDPLYGLWFNTKSMGASLWTGLRVNSLIEVNGEVYGATSAGLVKMEHGAQTIVSEVVWDLVDFDDAQLKKVDMAYVAGDSVAPFQFDVTTSEGTWSYATHLPSAESPMNHRATLGKGLRARYYRFAVSNPDGADFGVNDVGVLIGDTSRRR
jgi:hypothetical protein